MMETDVKERKSANLVLTTMPLSTNSLYAHVGRRRFLTGKAKDNKESLQWEARVQFKGAPFIDQVGVYINLYWPNARNHDLDNIKILLDAMTGILWIDDKQIQNIRIAKHIDRESPRVEMQIVKL